MDFFSPLLDLLTGLYKIFLDNPLAQIVGFAGLAMSLLTFLSGNDKKFLTRMTWASVLWAIHFLLMGLLSAGLLNVVDVIKNLLVMKYPKNQKISAAMVIIYIAIGVFVFSKSGLWTDWLPVLGSIASTIILFTLTGVWMRVAFLFVLAGWVTYNFLGHSIGGVLTDVTLFITGIIGIITMKTGDQKIEEK